MPHSINNDQDGLGVLITFHGQINASEIHDLNNELMANELFLQWRYQIWDFSNTEKFTASFDELRNFAKQDANAAKINPNQKIAIIRRKHGSSYSDSVFHIYEEVWGGYESKTFTDLASAREWATRDNDQENKATS